MRESIVSTACAFTLIASSSMITTGENELKSKLENVALNNLKIKTENNILN